MLFQELKNFKGVLAFMLVPIIGLMMEGYVAAGIWTAVLVYAALPALVMALDAMNVGQTVNNVTATGVANTFVLDDDLAPFDGLQKFQNDLKNSLAYNHLPTNIWYRPFED